MKLPTTLFLTLAVSLTLFELGYSLSPRHERNGFPHRTRAVEIRISAVRLNNDFDLLTMQDGRFHIIGPETLLIEANDGFIFGSLDADGYIRVILNRLYEPVKVNANRLFDTPVRLAPGEREFYYIDELFLEAFNLSDSVYRNRIGHPNPRNINGHSDHGDINGHSDHGDINGHPDRGDRNGHPHHRGMNGH